MFGHLSKERLWELTEPWQAPSTTERGHLEACRSCSGRFMEVREGRELLEGILCEETEPPSGHFDALRDGVRRRIAAEVAEAAGRPGWGPVWHMLPAALAVAVAVLPLVRPAAPVDGRSREARAWTALPETEDDQGIDLLRAAADEMEGDLADDLGFSPALVAVLDDASDDEALAVAREAFGEAREAGRL